ncbi:hypothetical protein [Pimelobacter simplex]|uniref:hypothetical protein n=1 Tax=Nocardioides simplex TaxID=2045 RepID=UPI00215035D6|nr:hypothetical protein [Pimelobacter simplex]UUW88394.1 hypothetical protein M0M43_21980 [Pimelobacter simplex]UUW97898.1 hypothetical protein M0M48_10625 [Pimelobacter simplex]
MSNFAPKRTTYSTADTRWCRNLLKASTRGVSVAFADVVKDGTGLVKSGSLVAGKGLVLNEYVHKTGETHLISIVDGGDVDRRYLPAALTLAQESALKNINFINGTVPS